MNLVPNILRKKDLPVDRTEDELLKELEEMVLDIPETKADPTYNGDSFKAPEAPPARPYLKPVLSLQKNIDTLTNYREMYQRAKEDTDEEIKRLQALSFEQGAVISGVTKAIEDMESHIPKVPLNKKLEQKIKRSADELRAEANRTESPIEERETVA